MRWDVRRPTAPGGRIFKFRLNFAGDVGTESFPGRRLALGDRSDELCGPVRIEDNYSAVLLV